MSKPQEEHLKGARSKIKDLCISEKKRRISADILRGQSSEISDDVTQTAISYYDVTADDLGLAPGEHITDFDEKSIRDALLRRDETQVSNNHKALLSGKNTAYARFEVTIGDQISRRSETILSIINNVNKQQKKRLISGISTSISTEIFDPWFDQNPFSQKHEIIHQLIEDTEHNAKSSIDSGNISSLEYNLNIYYQLMDSILLNKNRYSINDLPTNPTNYLFNSLQILFIYSIMNDTRDKATRNQILSTIIQTVYLISQKSKDVHDREKESEKAENLLTDFRQLVKTNNMDELTNISPILHEFE